MTTPDVARNDVLEGIGFIPRGPETQIYSIENTDLSLVATAEITLGGLLAGQTIDAERSADQALRHQPLFPHRGRRPRPGTRGLYRVHQFTKIEMFAYTLPEASDAMLDYLRGLECRLFDGLGIPYRVVDTATGDLGGPAYRKFDLEAWMPGRGERRVRRSHQHLELHRLSGPAAERALQAQGREGDASSSTRSTAPPSPSAAALIAILENYQQADGTILIPEVLRGFVGKERIGVRG